MVPRYPNILVCNILVLSAGKTQLYQGEGECYCCLLRSINVYSVIALFAQGSRAVAADKSVQHVQYTAVFDIICGKSRQLIIKKESPVVVSSGACDNLKNNQCQLFIKYI